jgi:NADP-dependent 3-hydroxy acid dehydrogenase YdfG
MLLEKFIAPNTHFLSFVLLLLLFFLDNSSAMSTTNLRRLSGKVICVTGASSGIGAAVAEALYAEGANICIGARRLDRLEEVATQCKTKYGGAAPAGNKIVPCQVDVTDRSSVINMVKTATSQLGVASLDAMVCCAGVMYFTKMVNAKMDEWDRTIDVNCRGVTNCYGAVIPDMVKHGKGRIVTISSDAGVRDFPNLAVYCASKKFVETVTEITRRELVGTGVTMCTIQPGDVKGTELILHNTDKEAGEAMGVELGKPVGEGFKRTQLLDPHDIAGAVVYAITAPPHVAVNSILIEPRDQE